MGKDSTDGGKGEGMEEKRGNKKGQMWHSYVPILYDKCIHYLLQTCTNRKKAPISGALYLQAVLSP